MTEEEAREWLGLPGDRELTELGRQVMKACESIPMSRGPGDNIRIFKDFLKAMNEAGIKPPRKPLVQGGYKE